MADDLDTRGIGEERLQLVACGGTPQAALAIALAKSLEVLTGQPGETDEDLPARAVPIRASGPHLSAVARMLIEALFEEIAGEHRVCAVRLDGLLHREDGFRAWGYAFIDEAAPGAGQSGWLESLTVDEVGAGTIEIRASIVVAAPPGDRLDESLLHNCTSPI